RRQRLSVRRLSGACGLVSQLRSSRALQEAEAARRPARPLRSIGRIPRTQVMTESARREGGAKPGALAVRMVPWQAATRAPDDSPRRAGTRRARLFVEL